MILFGDRIFTNRLTLRKIEEVDLPVVAGWSVSEEACGPYLTPVRLELEEIRRQFETGVFWNDREKTFLVELKNGSQALGTAHYWRLAAREDAVSMALKVALPAERGKGYGTELQKFLIMWIFDHYPVVAVEMHVDVNNIAQQRCLQKLGFELVESLVYQDQQKKRTGHLFRLTAKQYRSHPIYQFHYE